MLAEVPIESYYSPVRFRRLPQPLGSRRALEAKLRCEDVERSLAVPVFGQDASFADLASRGRLGNLGVVRAAAVSRVSRRQLGNFSDGIPRNRPRLQSPRPLRNVHTRPQTPGMPEAGSAAQNGPQPRGERETGARGGDLSRVGENDHGAGLRCRVTKESVTLVLVIVVGGFALIQVLLLLGVGLMDLFVVVMGGD